LLVEYCFNSKVVRLKAGYSRTTGKPVEFQFQSGTVKRIGKEPDKVVLAVSIPKWYG